MFYRYFITAWFCCLLIPNCFAQQDQNLVPNGHFEDYYMCPDDLYQLDRLVSWTSFRGSPDYFNACDEANFVGVPFSIANGYQEARSGQGYAGIIGLAGNNDREILAAQLTESLEIGQDYYIELHYSRTFGGGANSNCDCATSHLGLTFTTTTYEPISNPIPILNEAVLYTTEVIADTVNWVKVSGWFTADSAYSHIALGNFFDLDICQTEYYNGSPDEIVLKTYYFIEDICVATDPIFCDIWNYSQELSSQAHLFLNRVDQNHIQIMGQTEIISAVVYDAIGRKIHQHDLKNDPIIDIGFLKEGSYIIAVKTRQGKQALRFVK